MALFFLLFLIREIIPLQTGFWSPCYVVFFYTPLVAVYLIPVRQKYLRNNFVIHTYSFTFAVPKSLYGNLDVIVNRHKKTR
ncbi:hypothetical protein J2T02_001018 [Chitinophaga terrae (ex Kim and Jung 2007)]|nr:hypothetical protein [Chitinophaga terrae (ex Kim and Jung 2007)]